jgi:hypothetical protein
MQGVGTSISQSPLLSADPYTAGHAWGSLATQINLSLAATELASGAVSSLSATLSRSANVSKVVKAVDAASQSLQHTPNQQTLIELAKEAKRTGISQGEAQTLLDWAKEYNVKPALDHTSPPFHAKGPHIRIGPVNHIYLK